MVYRITISHFKGHKKDQPRRNGLIHRNLSFSIRDKISLSNQQYDENPTMKPQDVFTKPGYRIFVQSTVGAHLLVGALGLWVLDGESAQAGLAVCSLFAGIFLCWVYVKLLRNIAGEPFNLAPRKVDLATAARVIAIATIFLALAASGTLASLKSASPLLDATVTAAFDAQKINATTAAATAQTVYGALAGLCVAAALIIAAKFLPYIFSGIGNRESVSALNAWRAMPWGNAVSAAIIAMAALAFGWLMTKGMGVLGAAMYAHAWPAIGMTIASLFLVIVTSAAHAFALIWAGERAFALSDKIYK